MLTREIAEDLCTLVALGFVAKTGSPSATSPSALNRFEYAAGEDKDYAGVRDLFDSVGVTLNIAQSTDTPWIAATTPKVPNRDAAQLLTADYWKYLKPAADCANSKGPDAPRGAYIGGMSTISTLFIVGGSALEFYKPTFRAPDDTTVAASYDAAAKASNDARSCLMSGGKPTGVKVDLTDLTPEMPRITPQYPFPKGSLFKSYHGMIQALVKYQTNADTNSFVFEIALGKNTTKVSSCLPCSLLMTAAGKPASSTHLGRGDNWNIPPNCMQSVRKAWEAAITSYYQLGRGLMEKKRQLPADTAAYLSTNQANIPAVFLEALTFESSFVTKIQNTFTRAKPKS